MDTGFGSLHDKLNAILRALTTRDDHQQHIIEEHEKRLRDLETCVGRHATASADRRRTVAARRRDRREFYRMFAPADVRHRRREARRWLDEKAVRITNPLYAERRPGERLFASMASCSGIIMNRPSVSADGIHGLRTSA